eukprot:scaffold2597_cov116-Cylindrotheca_fusiformis.AAC.12
MVAFGKSILKARREEWNSAYLDYDRLKSIIDDINRTLTEQQTTSSSSSYRNSSNNGNDSESMPLTTTTTTPEHQMEELTALKKLFFRELATEVEKISLFTLQQQGILAKGIGTLRFEFVTVFQSHALDGNATIENRLDHYASVGVELLHLLRFICFNSIGVRKILKKYNKVFDRMDESHYYSIDGNHLQQLGFSTSMVAMQTTLDMELARLYYEMHGIETMSETNLAFYRFQCIMDCANSIRLYAEILQRPFWNFLSQASMIGTSMNFGGMDQAGNDAMKWLMRLKPDELLTMDENQLRTIWHRWSSGPANNIRVMKDAVPRMPNRELHTIREESTGSILEADPAGTAADGGIMIPPQPERGPYWGGVNWISMALNLLSKLLYTVNYYIIAPTANHYAIALGLDGAFGATLIGASSVSAFFGAFLFSFWYTKSTFKSALLFSAVCPVIGNALYALAISCNSMRMAIIGRILVGFGSAEVVNRQLISACVGFDGMTKASALFVTADAIGMSIGPLLAGILAVASGRNMDVHLDLPFLPVGGIIFNHVTSPGFVMGALWLIELLALMIFFHEPERTNESDTLSDWSSASDDDDIEDAEKAQTEKDKLTTDKPVYGSVPTDENAVAQEPPLFMADLKYTIDLIFQNTGLPLTVLLFGYIEMTCEVLISSCSMVIRRYFDWHGSVAGFLIASLGALVLPAHFVVEKASHYFSERTILFRSLLFVFCSFLGMFNWSGLYYDLAGEVEVSTSGLDTTNVDNYKEAKIGNETIGALLTKKHEFPYDYGAGPVVYILFLSLIFVGIIVLEGVDTSIMAKTTPPKLNKCFLNTGLLATLVGTIGRVFADGIITSSALLDRHIFVDFVNATFFPLMILALIGLIAVNTLYDRLVQ